MEEEVAESTWHQEPIELFEIASWEELYRGVRDASASVIDFSVGPNDGRVYCLFRHSLAAEEEPPRYYYAVAILDVDWEARRYLGKQVYELGDDYRTEYNWIRVLGDDFLLVGRWSDYNGGKPERNGLLVGRDGTAKRDYCFGSSIDACLVMADGTIVMGYDDTESFADAHGLDLDHPYFSLDGIVAFRPDGTQFWNSGKHGYAFLHMCTALSQDVQGCMWAFYDTWESDPELDRDRKLYDYLEEWEWNTDEITDSCQLAKTDFQGECEIFIRCSNFINRSSAFAVAPSQRKMLFRGGVFHESGFFLVTRKGNSWVAEAGMVPQLNGQPFNWKERWWCQFTDYRTLWMGSEGLYGYRFV